MSVPIILNQVEQQPVGAVARMYKERIKPLPYFDRLQLARLIMDDLVESDPRLAANYSETWTDEDLSDFRHSSTAYLNTTLKDEENVQVG